MAPECILENKKTVHSDVLSLGCTLVELFTEHDCWEDLLHENKPSTREDFDAAAQEINSLIAHMKNQSSHMLGLPPNSINTSVQHILEKCFRNESGQRYCATGLLNALLQSNTQI